MAKCKCVAVSHGHGQSPCEREATEFDLRCKECHDKLLAEGRKKVIDGTPLSNEEEDAITFDRVKDSMD